MGGDIKKLVFFLILTFSIFSLPFFGQEEELSLQEIDALIKQTDYDKAMAELSAYMKKYPDRLDLAQRRVDAIMRARSYYTRLANELIDVMENEPENAEKKLAIIKELESLEKHPTQEHLAFIKQAKSAAEFTYYRAQFRRIMEEGAKNAQGQKYADALAVIQSGFYMYRDEFYDDNPDQTTRPVTQIVAGIGAACQNYLALRQSVNDACKAFVQAAESGNVQNAARAKENFFARMEELASVRNRILAAGQRLEGVFAAMKKQNPELTEASYLSFMSRFSLGIASISDSGLLGAMDFEWKSLLENSKNAVAKAARQKFDDAVKAAPMQKAMETPFAPDYARYSEAASFAGLGLEVCALDRFRLGRDGKPLQSDATVYMASMRAAQKFSGETKDSVDNLDEFKAASARLAALDVPQEPLQDARNGDAYANGLLGAIAMLDKTRTKAQSALAQTWFVDYKNSLEPKASASDGKAFEFRSALDFYQDINSLVQNSSASTSEAAWKKMETHALALADSIFGNNQNLFEEAEERLQSHYPDQALQKIKQAQETISGDKALLLLSRQRLLDGQMQSSPAVRRTDEALASLDRWSSDGQSVAARARQEMLMAQSAQSQAEEVLRRAESAFKAENFTKARSDLQRARELYNESLGHQESEALRSSSDKNLATLGQRINDAENKIIVTEVRALKTKAKNEYYAGNFESAESLLNRAQSRWAVTNVEEDEEIKNLTLLVQNALSMKTGREIKPTAPLYPEMSQILSNARQYFDQGAKLIKDGKRDEALPILAEAKKKLQELQLIYPLNQEAALLTLRIDELTDPAQFNETFARRVQAARQNVKVPATQRQAYSDLLDLAEIRPNYPGLKKLIYDVEVEIGVRQKPVDQASLRRSDALAKEARRLYDGARGNEGVLRDALARLDQAIALNPNNEAAITLKDRIQIAVGGKAAVVLSSEDEANYNKAIQELRANNVVGAYTIVERLLQKPENRRSSKILDLQKQVQARM